MHVSCFIGYSNYPWKCFVCVYHWGLTVSETPASQTGTIQLAMCSVLYRRHKTVYCQFTYSNGIPKTETSHHFHCSVHTEIRQRCVMHDVRLKKQRRMHMVQETGQWPNFQNRGLKKKRKVSWIAERLLASHEPCSVGLVILLSRVQTQTCMRTSTDE